MVSSLSGIPHGEWHANNVLKQNKQVCTLDYTTLCGV